MAIVLPFRALRYNSKRVKIDKVTAPPYDVINPAYQNTLYGRDVHNVVRLILGKIKSSDTTKDNRYTRAAAFLKDWRQKGVIVQEDKPCFYVYEQRYRVPESNQVKTRTTLFAALQLEPLGKGTVYPHERTHKKAKVDRTHLLKAVKTNLSPVFGLYEDGSQLVRKQFMKAQKTKLYTYTDDNKIHHTLYRVEDDKYLRDIQRLMKTKKIFIADGHHRYETALAHSEAVHKRKQARRGILASDYIYVGLCNLEDAGLEVLPIHRVMTGLKSFKPDQFVKKMSELFVLKKIHPTMLKEKLLTSKTGTPHFGIYLGRSGTYWVQAKDVRKIKKVMPKGRVPAWYDLDVAWVSEIIMKYILKLDDHQMDQQCTYKAAWDDAIGMINAKKAQVAILMRPTSLASVKKMCIQKERMPQKSTFFYPKLPSGLLFHKH